MAKPPVMDNSYVQLTFKCADNELVALKRAKKESGALTGKSVVVLKPCDVVERDGTVFMPNTIEMAQLKKLEKGQFKTNVQISSKMNEMDIKRILVETFPFLANKRFYCAGAADNRTRLEFHGDRRIWDGRLIKQNIKGNSALYIYTDEVASMAQSHAVAGSVQQTLQQNVDEPVPLKRKKKDPGAPTGKSVVVLKSNNVTIRNNSVLMPSTSEMARLKKEEKGQFVTNVQIYSTMSQQDIRELLISLFPYLGDQRFYCASALDNRRRLDFHGERRIWDGRQIEQKIEGNSTLYIYTDEGSLGKQDSTSSKQLTLKRPHDQMTPTMQGECRIDKGGDVSIMTQGGIHAQSGMTQNIVSTASQSQSRKPTMHIADGQAEGRNTIPSKSSLQGIVSSSLTRQLNSLNITSAASEQERGQLGQTAADGYALAHVPLQATTRQGQGNGVATRGQVIACNSTDQSKRGYVVSAEVDQCAGKSGSVSYAITDVHEEYSGTSGSDFESRLSDSAVERLLDSGIEGSDHDNLFVGDTVENICPESGSVKGGFRFIIELKEALPDEVKKGVAEFEGVEAVIVDKRNSLLLSGTVPPSQKAGDVTVTVRTDSGRYIGFTVFTYEDDVKEMVKNIVKDETLQIKFFKEYYRELEMKNLPSDGRKTEALDSSVEMKQKQSLELLQLMIYTAAQTNAQRFIEMVFSTSAGQVIFNYYKDRTPLPEDVARANGYDKLAQYLQDVHTRLSLDKNAHSTLIDWLELVEAVQKQSLTTQYESSVGLDQSDEDDDDSSDYFADAETSSRGSFDDDPEWLEISEKKGAAFSAINTPTALHETEESPAKRNHLKRGAYKEGPIVEPWFGLGWFELATDWLLRVLPIITVVTLMLSGTTTVVMLSAETSTTNSPSHHRWNCTSCIPCFKFPPSYGVKSTCGKKQETDCRECWLGYDYSNTTAVKCCMARSGCSDGIYIELSAHDRLFTRQWSTKILSDQNVDGDRIRTKVHLEIVEAICTPPCLLFSNTTDIIAVDYKTSAVHSVVSGLTRAVALDVHFSMGYIFWSDVSERNIKRSGIDGSSITTIITNIGVCDVLAVEWSASELYWSDTTHDTISKSDLSGNNQQTVLSLGLIEPRDIALDPYKGLMIWTDWGSSPKIEKASLTGNQRVAIVTSNIQWPNGIELDTWNHRIYWVDGAVDQLESVDYDGNDRKLLATVTNFHGFGNFHGFPPFLFFTDWASNGQIHQVDAETGYFVVSGVRFTGRPKGIVAYDSSRQPPVSSSCATNNGGCSHFCVVKTSGGYECVCPVGLSLKADGKTCNKKIDKFLVFTDADAKSTDIISLDVNYFVARRLFFHHGNKRPIAVDYDPVEDRVYWTDVAQGLIISAISNATSLRIPFRCNVKVPDGLAIDHVEQNIYWTDTGTNRIEVARLDGTGRKLLIKDGLDEPREIVLDERNGTMYWSDWGFNPMIEQAAMDGSSRRTIVTGNLGWPNGLTIDQTTSLLYWADAKLDKIEVSNFKGDNRRVIMLSAADIHPFGMTVYKSILYWTDWNNKNISRYDLNNGNTEVIIQGLEKPMDIHLYDSSRVFSGSHPCTINNGNCSDLCLLTPQGGHQCACPTGVVLKPDGKNCNCDLFRKLSSDKFMLFAGANSGEIYKVPLAVPDTPCSPLGIKTNISRPVAVDYDPIEGKVYWTDVVLKQIVRSYPNGWDLEVIAESNVENPDGIAVDWIGRNVYWTDDQTSKIEVSRLDGSYRFSLFTSGLDDPRAVILDIDARKMYWSDWGSSPKIEQANMDGTARTVLVSSGLSWVNSLALDFKNRLLYWCDAQLDRIERVDLQGNNRVLILDLSSNNDSYHPFGLALYEDLLFWTDWTTKSVHRYNMTSSLSDVLVHGMGTPMEIHIYDYSIITSGTTSCSHLNGGCSHICLPNPNGHQCFCPEGVHLIPGDSSTCQGVNRCPQLFAPVHGSLLPCSNLPGQSCVFSCDQGYLLSGVSTRTCQGDGSWTGVETHCTVVTCPSLPTPSNGTRQGCSGASTEIYNTVCQFSCHPGFVSVGSSSRTCLQNGSWSGQDFVCQAIICPPLSTPPKALLLTPSCGSTYGSSCRYSCQSGYTSFTGKVTRTCLLNGQWSGNDINCTDTQPPDFGATCPAKPLTAYAEREMLSAFVNWTQPLATDNSGVSITVTSNYQSPTRFSQGTHVITYTAVDQSGNKVTCTFLVIILVINCTSLRVSPGGPLQMDSCGDHYGSKCNFSCSVGYRLNGSSTVTCNAPGNSPPGVWDSPIPVCHEITCQSHPDLINGEKRGCLNPVSERYSAICSFSCNVGYNLTGSSRRQCLENGTWSGVAPTCQVVNCSALTPPANGTVSPRSCLSRSTYGQTCSISCNTPGYVLEGTSARVCDKNGDWTGNKDTFCRDNTPPSFNGSCPRNIVVSLPKCSSSTGVSWNEPIASDNSGHMTVSYPAVRPPANLSIGLHYVHYSAADAEGNRANCSFVVQVIKRSCPVLQPPVYGTITSLSCGSAYGSQANIACNEGHRLVGSRVRSCEANGTWSGNITTCKIVKCPSIKALDNGKISPAPCTRSGGVSYKTQCFLQCDVSNGYGLDGPTQVSCLANGSWSGNISNISCKDIQPPSIQCPPNMETPTVAGKSYAIVTWQVPVPTDNSKGFLNLSGVLPPQRMNVGTNVIRYDVTDVEGLKGDCHFSIRVKDLEPPKIDPCPSDTKIISTARWYKLVLPSVNVTDNVGVELFTTDIKNGSEMTWGEYNVTYKALDRAGNAAYCRFLFTIADSPCEELAPPENGAKACETWLAGMMCTVHCNNGYGFANHPDPVYFCSPTTGEWFHERNNKGKKPSLPDCSKTHIPKSALVNGQYHYLTDSCGGETMREEIARNFIELLMKSRFGQAGACSDVSQCNIQNVKVECGVTTRRKRDTTSNQNTGTIPLTVSFSLQIPLSGDLNTSVDINQTSVQISKEVLTVLSKVDMTLNVSGMVIRTDPSKPPQFQLSRLVCEEGQVQSGVMCVNCPIGYFFDGTSCQACAVNQYQDQEAQNSCKSCPAGTTTSGQLASKKLQDCQDQLKTNSKKQSVLSKPMVIALIAGGSVVVIIALVLCGVFMMRKRQHPDSESCQNGFSNKVYLDLDELGPQVVMQSSNA